MTSEERIAAVGKMGPSLKLRTETKPDGTPDTERGTAGTERSTPDTERGGADTPLNTGQPQYWTMGQYELSFLVVLTYFYNFAV